MHTHSPAHAATCSSIYLSFKFALQRKKGLLMQQLEPNSHHDHPAAPAPQALRHGVRGVAARVRLKNQVASRQHAHVCVWLRHMNRTRGCCLKKSDVTSGIQRFMGSKGLSRLRLHTSLLPARQQTSTTQHDACRRHGARGGCHGRADRAHSCTAPTPAPRPGLQDEEARAQV